MAAGIPGIPGNPSHFFGLPVEYHHRRTESPRWENSRTKFNHSAQKNLPKLSDKNHPKTLRISEAGCGASLPASRCCDDAVRTSAGTAGDTCSHLSWSGFSTEIFVPPPLPTVSVSLRFHCRGITLAPPPNQLLGRYTKKSSCSDKDACGPLHFQEVTVRVLTSRFWRRREHGVPESKQREHLGLDAALVQGRDSVGALIAALGLGCAASFI